MFLVILTNCLEGSDVHGREGHVEWWRRTEEKEKEGLQFFVWIVEDHVD